MAVFRECANYEMCIENKLGFKENNKAEMAVLNCEGCFTYKIYKKGFDDGVRELTRKINMLAKEGSNDNDAIR